jgi:hypothetical protein
MQYSKFYDIKMSPLMYVLIAIIILIVLYRLFVYFTHNVTNEGYSNPNNLNDPNNFEVKFAYNPNTLYDGNVKNTPYDGHYGKVKQYYNKYPKENYDYMNKQYSNNTKPYGDYSVYGSYDGMTGYNEYNLYNEHFEDSNNTTNFDLPNAYEGMESVSLSPLIQAFQNYTYSMPDVNLTNSGSDVIPACSISSTPSDVAIHSESLPNMPMPIPPSTQASFSNDMPNIMSANGDNEFLTQYSATPMSITKYDNFVQAPNSGIITTVSDTNTNLTNMPTTSFTNY